MKKFTMFFLIAALLMTLIPTMPASARGGGSDAIPILFVHGWGGGEGTFKDMIRSLQPSAKIPVNKFSSDFIEKCLNYERMKNGTGRHAYTLANFDYNKCIEEGKVAENKDYREQIEQCNRWEATRKSGIGRAAVQLRNFKLAACLEEAESRINYAMEPRSIRINGTSYVISQVLYSFTDPNYQKEYIKQALDQISKRFAIREIHLVGHSMGGLGTWQFMVDCNASSTCAYKNKVTRYISIASPFDGLEDGFLENAPNLSPNIIKEFKKDYMNKDKIIANHDFSKLRVLSIAAEASCLGTLRVAKNMNSPKSRDQVGLMRLATKSLVERSCVATDTGGAGNFDIVNVDSALKITNTLGVQIPSIRNAAQAYIIEADHSSINRNSEAQKIVRDFLFSVRPTIHGMTIMRSSDKNFLSRDKISLQDFVNHNGSPINISTDSRTQALTVRYKNQTVVFPMIDSSRNASEYISINGQIYVPQGVLRP